MFILHGREDGLQLQIRWAKREDRGHWKMSTQVLLHGELCCPLCFPLVAQQALDSPGSCSCLRACSMTCLPAGIFLEGLVAYQSVYFGRILLLLVGWLAGWLVVH